MSKVKEKRAEIFAEVYAKTDSPLQAVLASEPKLAQNKAYASVKANRLLKKTDIQAKIQKNLEKMHPKALKKIDELINSDNEAIASANAWRVVEQLRGKPVARNLNLTAQVNIEDALFE